MKKNMKKTGFSQPMTSLDYYSENYMTTPIRSAIKSISKKTALRKNDSLTILYVTGGSGTAVINNKKHKLLPGVMIMLADYMAFMIIPDSETKLEYFECMFDYMLYLFFMSSSYIDFSVPGMGSEPVYALIGDSYSETCERIVYALLESHKKGGRFERDVLQLMQLMGILIRASEAEKLYPSPHRIFD
jgi:hypothetical protein